MTCHIVGICETAPKTWDKRVGVADAERMDGPASGPGVAEPGPKARLHAQGRTSGRSRVDQHPPTLSPSRLMNFSHKAMPPPNALPSFRFPAQASCFPLLLVGSHLRRDANPACLNLQQQDRERTERGIWAADLCPRAVRSEK